MVKFIIVKHARKSCLIKLRTSLGLGVSLPLDFNMRCNALIADIRAVYPRAYFEDSPTTRVLDVTLECPYEGDWIHVEAFNTHRSEVKISVAGVLGLVTEALGIEAISGSAVFAFKEGVCLG